MCYFFALRRPPAGDTSIINAITIPTIGHSVHCPSNHRCTAVNQRRLVGRKMNPRIGHSAVSNSPRNQFVKSVAEMAWMDYYVRGIGKKFSWRNVLTTLDDPASRPKVATDADPKR